MNSPSKKWATYIQTRLDTSLCLSDQRSKPHMTVHCGPRMLPLVPPTIPNAGACTDIPVVEDLSRYIVVLAVALCASCLSMVMVGSRDPEDFAVCAGVVEAWFSMASWAVSRAVAGTGRGSNGPAAGVTGIEDDGGDNPASRSLTGSDSAAMAWVSDVRSQDR